MEVPGMSGLEDDLGGKIKEGETTAAADAKREAERQAQTEGAKLEQDATNEAAQLEKNL
jgi:hypothetical protein